MVNWIDVVFVSVMIVWSIGLNFSVYPFTFKAEKKKETGYVMIGAPFSDLGFIFRN